MSKRIFKLTILVIIMAMIFPATALGGSHLVQVTLLHTNDFHGRLETDYTAPMVERAFHIMLRVGKRPLSLIGGVMLASAFLSASFSLSRTEIYSNSK